MFKDSLAIAKAEGDERLVTAASLNLANKQDGTGHVEDALATYADVLDRAKAQHDDENLAIAEMNRGDSLMKLDRYAEALPLVEAALASFQQRGDEDGVGFALASLGDAHFGLGELGAARADYESALALRTKLGEAHNVAKSQTQLARLDLAEDRAAEALAALDESTRIAPPPVASSEASEDALIRGLADPALAGAQLAIIHGAQQNAACARCVTAAYLDEAELERGLGHAGRARTLLQRALRRARSVHAENVAARAALLLSK